jgi:hypothetical protein
MLTVLQEKLADAHGLAIAASAVTAKVAERVSDTLLLDGLSSLRDDAGETRARCVLVERSLPAEIAAEVRARASSTHESAADLVGAWFKAGTDPLRAWTFLAMGEAAEVAAWEAVAVLAAAADADDVGKLAAWALPLQKRHLAFALDGVVTLAGSFDPAGPRWG